MLDAPANTLLVNRRNMQFDLDAGIAHRAAIGLVTPYIDENHHSMRRHIEERGTTVVGMASFNNGNANEVARISAASLEGAILDLGGAPDVEAVFVACTSLRVAGLIAAIEA